MNYYEILGVSNNAESEVIKAAYRALSKKYHPDTTSLDPQDATQRMQQVNLAYDTLSNAEKRKKYDAELKQRNRYDRTSDGNSRSSTDETEKAWQVALEYYPYLEACYQDLSKLSPQLAQSFKHTILRKKNYTSGYKLEKSIERNYLQNIFGPNDELQQFGKELILDGNDKAIEELRITATILGDNMPAFKVVNKIREKYYGTSHDSPNRNESSPDHMSSVLIAIVSLIFLILLGGFLA